MADITIETQDWEKLSLKLRRKYNHLTEEDLAFTPGKEEQLIAHLASRLKRTRDYVIFTLKKGLVNIDSNRL